MKTQVIGPFNNMCNQRSLQLIKLLPSMFNCIRLSTALLDEAAHRFRVRRTDMVALVHLGVPIELLVADGNKMFQAKFLALKR
jgi:hypothetical protein